MQIQEGQAYVGADGAAMLIVAIADGVATVRPIMADIEMDVPLPVIEGWATSEYERDRGRVVDDT